jgi:inorganic triphosphatase YgiF
MRLGALPSSTVAMTEFELKFQVPPERAEAVRAALARGEVERTQLRARYFDTSDEALVRAGIALRLRQEGERCVQTAKGRGAAFERLEHNAPALEGEDGKPDVRLHDAHPIGKRLHAALEDAASGLHTVFETDIVRLSRTVESAGAQVEVALDEGEIRAGARHQPVLELEFELTQGTPAALVELAQQWCEQHGLWLDPLSKAGMGWRLAHDEAQPPALQAQRVEDADTPHALTAAILGAALRQVLGNARELAAGDGGDAHVHQLRVGLRRLRTSLRDLEPLHPLQALRAEVEPALKALFGVLGEHRDRATLVPRLQQDVAAVGGPALAWRPELPDVGAAVRAPDLQRALLRLVGFVQELAHAHDDRGLKDARKDIAARLEKLHRKLLRAGQRFERLAQEDRHAERKRLKRLRYLAELTRPLFAGRAVDDYVDALKRLQDALGAYQDAVAGRALFARHADDEPVAWFAAGWLAAREETLAAECERACRKTARQAQPYWD